MMQSHWQQPAPVRGRSSMTARPLEITKTAGRPALRRRRALHAISRMQVDAIRETMRLLVEKDESSGVDPRERRYCDACERMRAAAGFVRYDRYDVCNACATEYEVANARGVAVTAGQYVRDKNFGETAAYALDPE